MTITKKKAGRSCLCGHVFSPMAPVHNRKFESFAIISDKGYQSFLKAEVRVLQATDAIAKARAIAHASKFVGSLLECPACGRFLLTMPGSRSEALLVKENTRRKPSSAWSKKAAAKIHRRSAS